MGVQLNAPSNGNFPTEMCLADGKPIRTLSRRGLLPQMTVQAVCSKERYPSRDFYTITEHPVTCSHRIEATWQIGPNSNHRRPKDVEPDVHAKAAQALGYRI
jgi:hypothetical protein